MPALPEVAAAHARDRLTLVETIADEAAKAWRKVDANRIVDSWLTRMVPLLTILTGTQQVAAAEADGYLDEALDAQGIDPAAAAKLVPEALAGIASDGRTLEGLLLQPPLGVLELIRAGTGVDEAMSSGGFLLDMMVRTQVADAGRVADQIATTARPQATGYVRVLVGRSCSRCAILAGRWYRYDAGFNRHPKCDCIGAPGRQETAGDLTTDPKAYFASLSAAEQDRQFTKAGAEAIRLGADPAQVVNARRGAKGLTPAGARITAEEAKLLRGGRERGRLETTNVFGRDLFITTEGTTTRGQAGVRLGARETETKLATDRYRRAKAPRLMPESILAIATSREEAIRLLKRNGFIR